jgi:hypothetical protein
VDVYHGDDVLLKITYSFHSSTSGRPTYPSEVHVLLSSGMLSHLGADFGAVTAGGGTIAALLHVRVIFAFLGAAVADAFTKLAKLLGEFPAHAHDLGGGITERDAFEIELDAAEHPPFAAHFARHPLTQARQDRIYSQKYSAVVSLWTALSLSVAGQDDRCFNLARGDCPIFS